MIFSLTKIFNKQFKNYNAMFNLFSKKKESPVTEVAVAEITQPKKQYPKVVEDIHNEFFTAGDNILQEATSLLKQLETQDLAKGKRLAAMGFNKTIEAVVAIETENKVATTKEIADLVMYYRINYPHNKFITEEQVKQICEKYGLVLGQTSAYKGFVPENKLSLIESFKVKKQDIILASITDIDGNILHYFTKESSFCCAWSKERLKNKDSFYHDSSRGFREYNNLFNIPKFSQVKFDNIGLQICAPLKDMEIGNRQQLVGYKIQDIPDPVVLQPVKGGYLIVCAWGDEASDEIVVNEISN